MACSNFPQIDENFASTGHQWPRQAAAAMSTVSSLDWRIGHDSGMVYGVPQGLSVRGTFLEWADEVDSEIFECRTGQGSRDLTEAQLHLYDCRMQRSRSCPVLKFGEACVGSDSSVSTDVPNAEDKVDADEYVLGCVWPEADAWRNAAESSWWEANANSCGRGKSSASPSSSSVLVLRGLPFNTTEAEIAAFLKKSGVKQESLIPDRKIVLLANVQGRASGFAEIHLAPGADFNDIRNRLHMQHLGGRYIEALPPRSTKKLGGSGRKPKGWRRSGSGV